MNPKQRIDLISDIAKKLQKDHTTSDINVILGGYGLKTEQVTMVDSKKNYVMSLLKEQPDRLILKIATEFQIEIPENLEVPTPLTSDKLSPFLKKIFISHSTKDKELVEKIIDLLETIGLSNEDIFCSSFEGYGIRLWDNFLDSIKNELNSDVLVLFILSNNFYQSPVCLCEMGAAWVTTKQHIPVLIPPFKFEEIEGVIPLTQGLIINDKLKLNSLKEKVEAFFKLSPLNISVWERKRDNILKDIELLIKS